MKKIAVLLMILLITSLFGCDSQNIPTSYESDTSESKMETESSGNSSMQESIPLSEADGLRFLDDIGITFKQLKEKYGRTIPWESGNERANDGSVVFEGFPEGTQFQVGWPSKYAPPSDDVNGDTALCVCGRSKFKDAFPYLVEPVTQEQFSAMFNLTFTKKTIYNSLYTPMIYGEVVFSYNDFSVQVQIDSNELISLEGDYAIYRVNL